MARKRPSIQKREREFQKRQRGVRKAEKAEAKRLRREGQPDAAPPPDTTPGVNPLTGGEQP